MISFIRGELVNIEEASIVLENQGIGYQIFVPGSLIEKIPALGSEVQIFTYLHVREDAMQLYGFLTRDDLKIFKMLLGVSGIGPKGALGVLSAITPDELRFAVLAGDAKTIAKAPGIGGKTAQKVIIELKDKLSTAEILGMSEDQTAPAAVENSAKQEASLALTALGYTSADAMRAVSKVAVTDDMDCEAILRDALKKLI